MLVCAGMKNKSLVSSYLDSAKIQWMYTWSFCSERGKHVKWCCDVGMMLLSFVSHLTKSLACMFFLSCIILAWMENQSTKQKWEAREQNSQLIEPYWAQLLPTSHFIMVEFVYFHYKWWFKTRYHHKMPKCLSLGWFYWKLTESVVSKIMNLTDQSKNKCCCEVPLLKKSEAWDRRTSSSLMMSYPEFCRARSFTTALHRGVLKHFSLTSVFVKFVDDTDWEDLHCFCNLLCSSSVGVLKAVFLSSWWNTHPALLYILLENKQGVCFVLFFFTESLSFTSILQLILCPGVCVLVAFLPMTQWTGSPGPRLPRGTSTGDREPALVMAPERYWELKLLRPTTSNLTSGL